tara:strand:+ start:136 stop:462 length:327 start_codon:yes stop_codon:yes gene_type:complete
VDNIPFLANEALFPRPKLTEQHEKYFDLSAHYELVRLSDLEFDHFIEKSAKNAYDLMLKAAKGEIEKRAPISAIRQPERLQRYLIVDGNTTAAVALYSNWKTIPVQIP